MHTDEYEISLNREVQHCIHVITQIRASLLKREQQYGMGYGPAALAAAKGQIQINAKSLAQWEDDVLALPQWEQRLKEYRAALAGMRISAGSDKKALPGKNSSS